MKKILSLITIYILITSCGVKRNIDHHGVHQLVKKNKLLIIGETNKNDMFELLGPPSVESTFDTDVLFYIERKIVTKSLIKLGDRQIIVNNVLVTEFDSRGLLINKDLYDLNQMNDLEITKSTTTVDYQKTSFIYNFLSSMRQKINDPLGKRKRD
jgi:outer membrane protein assembly factor BamE (lipoprotein component of BamABCDE complex)